MVDNKKRLKLSANELTAPTTGNHSANSSWNNMKDFKARTRSNQPHMMISHVSNEASDNEEPRHLPL